MAAAEAEPSAGRPPVPARPAAEEASAAPRAPGARRRGHARHWLLLITLTVSAAGERFSPPAVGWHRYSAVEQMSWRCCRKHDSANTCTALNELFK